MVAATLLVGGCGTADGASAEPDRSYDGSLYVPGEEARHAGAGAAGDIVDCQVWGAGGFSDEEIYGSGATAGTAEQALAVARSEGIFGGVQDGLTVAKEESDRVLYVLEVGGVRKQAVIVRDGPATEGAGGHGWYVESWAHCDYSELPDSFADSIGLQIWSDSSGRPVPTTTIESWLGPEHCDWQSMTFLSLGRSTYVRDPQPDLADFFAEPYRPHATLPPGAVDTGFERDGEHLWLAPDDGRAFVGTTDEVEVWPRTTRPLGCE